MKKFFTLFAAAAAMCVSASAEVIYSWESEGPDAVTQIGGTATGYVDDTRVNYPNTCNGTTYYTICLSGKKGTYPESAYVNITLDQPLAEGDVISVTAYRNKNEAGKNVTVEFLFNGDKENSIASTEQFANINPDGEADPAPTTQTFTVPESAAGCKSFDMTRGSASTNLFITKIEITREGGDVEEPGDEALMHWDFTNWSAETVANLKAGANWTDIEKADQTEPTEKSKDNCYWQINPEEGLSPEKYVMANDVVIEELEGLIYTNTKARVLTIALNYPDPDPVSGFGPYHGSQYLWMNTKDVNFFTIPNVPAGAIIKMGVESHKLTQARGVQLLLGETALTAPNGEAVAYPTTYEEQEWMVPANADESNDIVIRPSVGGCHIYFITVTEGEAGGTTGVAAVEAEGAVEYYNLQGVRVANPENGLYIKRQGNKAVKVLVK